MKKQLLKELQDFDRYLKREVKKKTGKQNPSNQDYIDFLERLGDDLLAQIKSTHH